jgi:putative colanic acid biosynthesis UDP-glucose lipid carrier transferase
MFKDSAKLDFYRRLLDVLIVLIAAHLVSRIHFSLPMSELPPIYLAVMYVCAGLVFYLFPEFYVYKSWRGRPMALMLLQIVLAWFTVALIGLVFSYLVHRSSELSRLWMLYWTVATSVMLLAQRLIVHVSLHLLRKKGLNTKKVVLVGYGDIGRQMHQRALQQDWVGYEIKAIHCNAEEGRAIFDRNIARIDDVKAIAEFVDANHIDEIWLALPISEHEKLSRLQYMLRNALCDIRWIPDLPGASIISRRPVTFMGMIAVELNRPVSHGLRGFAKEAFDRLFALAVLAFLALPFLFIGICIKLSSSGPVFFRQVRHGMNGKKFMIYKFRTMKMHAEKSTVTQAKKNDARVTWIGSFLRKTSIDELPQFINVLLGDMSIVGPRPHALEHNEYYRDELDIYMLRHRVKPGITGWAQINGLRGETDTVEKMQKRVQFDLHYIANWSFALDVKIILWTALKGWTGKNVY